MQFYVFDKSHLNFQSNLISQQLEKNGIEWLWISMGRRFNSQAKFFVIIENLF